MKQNEREEKRGGGELSQRERVGLHRSHAPVRIGEQVGEYQQVARISDLPDILESTHVAGIVNAPAEAHRSGYRHFHLVRAPNISLANTTRFVDPPRCTMHALQVKAKYGNINRPRGFPK